MKRKTRNKNSSKKSTPVVKTESEPNTTVSIANKKQEITTRSKSESEKSSKKSESEKPMVKIEEESSSSSSSSSPPSSVTDSVLTPSFSSPENTYLVVELKLITIDVDARRNKLGAVDDENYQPIFVCLNACANAAHLVALVNKKLDLGENEFDIVLMCNGYEVRPQCPLTALKNRFFADKDTVKIYYAIVGKKV